MYDEDRTADELQQNSGRCEIMWNGVKYEFWIEDETIVLDPIESVTDPLEERDVTQTRLSKQEVTEYLQNPDHPFNTYC